MKKPLIIGTITYFIITVLGGLFMYWFVGSMNFFGEQGFHGTLSDFIEGAISAGLIVAPLITAIVLRICKYKKPAKYMFITAIICWVFFLGVVPLFNMVTEKIKDSQPPAKIAMRAIERTDKDLDEGGEDLDSAHYADRVGNRLWIYEGTATRLDPSKEKAVVEEAAKLVIEKSDAGKIEPSLKDYGWRTVRYEGEINYIGMVLFYDDDSYVIMYDMDGDRWEETGERIPPDKEEGKNRLW